MDISKNFLYIKRIRTVIKSELKKRASLIHVNGRHSDAFVYILYGSCTYCFENGNSFTAKKGDILYLSEKSIYTMDINTPNYKFIFCDFDFEDLHQKTSALYSLDSVFDIENKFRILLKAYNNNLFAECLSVIYGIYNILFTISDNCYIGKNTKNKIEIAKEYIHKNYKDKNLSVALLAEKSNMSEVYFRKIFKSQYKVSPSQYIIALRIEKARDLMKYPFFTLEDCVKESGFSNVQYFCKVFKKTYNLTPTKFRNTL